MGTVGSDNLVKIWNITNINWSPIRTYTGHSGEVLALEWINENTLASGSSDSTIQIWSLQTGLTQTSIYTENSVWSLKLLTNGVYIAAGLQNGQIQIYNKDTGSLVQSLLGHTNSVYDLCLITNGNSNLLASSSGDLTIRIWDLNTNLNKFVLNGHTANVVGLKQISSDILSSGSGDKTIKLWNITSRALIRTLSNHTSWISWGLDLSADGQTLISCSGDQTIKFWHWPTGQCLNTINAGVSAWSLSILNTENIVSQNGISYSTF